jgi:hypothetical protein
LHYGNSEIVEAFLDELQFRIKLRDLSRHHLASDAEGVADRGRAHCSATSDAEVRLSTNCGHRMPRLNYYRSESASLGRTHAGRRIDGRIPGSAGPVFTFARELYYELLENIYPCFGCQSAPRQLSVE